MAYAHEDELTELDRHFADFVCRLAGRGDSWLWRAAALTSNATGRGNVCLELATALPPESVGAAALAGWIEHLRAVPLVGAPGETTPLVLDAAGRLYLHRFWEYEAALAAALLARSRQECPVDEALLGEGVRRLFPPVVADEPDWQLVAALTALCRPLAVISGGPGTGKTATVVKVLALLLEQARGVSCSLALAAPTGKAAARLAEAIRTAKQGLPVAPAILEQLPEAVTTIHRLLAYHPPSGAFRHHRDNPLPYAAVVVDEASMVDLPLMARLVEALPPTARLILLGDKDQLASVEAGAVLGDICDTGRLHAFSPSFRERLARLAGSALPAAGPAPESPLGDSLVVLRKSYRFGAESGIGALARLINEGRGEEALALLKAGGCGDLAWRELPAAEELECQLREPLVAGYDEFRATAEPLAALAAFGRFRVLCAHRQGPYGVATLNGLAERLLGLPTGVGGEWYPGRPVLITENDYPRGLFNGDIGIVQAAPDDGQRLAAFFPAPAGGVTRHLPLRLPGHETVFAMTVHKSQGSEFERVLLILPDRASAIVTRELIYTAVTRARQRVEVWGRDELFVAAVGTRISRSSGLRDLLWAGPGGEEA